MKKLIYNHARTGVACVVVPAPKEAIERVLGPLSDAEYKAHVIERSIPDGVDYREIDDEHIPKSREFRNAWVDKSNKPNVDICCEKARELVLKRVRDKREKKLLEQDKKLMQAIRKQEDASSINKETEALLDITNPLKAMDVKGKLNDKELLDKMLEIEAQLD
jgi:hypothetical protein